MKYKKGDKVKIIKSCFPEGLTMNGHPNYIGKITYVSGVTCGSIKLNITSNFPIVWNKAWLEKIK